MEARMNINQVEERTKFLSAIDKHLETTSISKHYRELIKIRASQINGCSYCIDKHTKDACSLGETEQRIYLLSVWREVDHFTEEERVILALTEEITLINKGGVSEETYSKAAKLFDQNYLAQIILAIISINSWNRIGVSLLMKPAADK